jgi:hypothetical protein
MLILRTRAAAASALLIAVLANPLHAASPKVHRLEATPSTVAYGYYWSEAKPVLRIASGDILDVDTLLTNSPTGLQKAGVADDRIQGSLKAIVAEVTGDRRGPGGHILTRLYSSRSSRRAHCSRSATATPRRATARSIIPRSKPRCAAASSSPSART